MNAAVTLALLAVAVFWLARRVVSLHGVMNLAGYALAALLLFLALIAGVLK